MKRKLNRQKNKLRIFFHKKWFKKKYFKKYKRTLNKQMYHWKFFDWKNNLRYRIADFKHIEFVNYKKTYLNTSNVYRFKFYAFVKKRLLLKVQKTIFFKKKRLKKNLRRINFKKKKLKTFLRRKIKLKKKNLK